MRLQSAIFDMDGTLLDSMHIWDGLAAATLRELGYAPEPDLYEHVKRTTLREGAQYCHDRYRTTQSVDELVAITQAGWEDFYRSRVQAKPGVIPFLTLLRMEDVSMYVATNTDRPWRRRPSATPASAASSGASSPAARPARASRTAPPSTRRPCGAFKGDKRKRHHFLRTPSTPSDRQGGGVSGSAGSTTPPPRRTSRRSAPWRTSTSAPSRSSPTPRPSGDRPVPGPPRQDRGPPAGFFIPL